MNIKDLRIDNTCFGKQKILADIRPYYDYKGSKDLEGYKYKVVLPALKMDSMEVKIKGSKRLELKEGTFPTVEFEGLEAKVYVIDGKPVISASATGIHLVNDKA